MVRSIEHRRKHHLYGRPRGTTVGRLKADLTAASQVRLISNVATAGAGAAAIRAQYSTDQLSWNYLDGTAGPSVTVGTPGLKVSGWVNVTAAAKADVFIRRWASTAMPRPTPRSRTYCCRSNSSGRADCLI
jgi:hypothetical protein